MTENKPEGGNQWQLTKEKILMVAGLAVIAYELIAVPILQQPFHIEFLILGAAFCGISIAGWGDKR